MRLYYRPRSGRPVRVAWTLEEIGAPYEAVAVSAEECGEPAHRARHPLGRVPVLEQDGACSFESAALCVHLAESHPDAALIGAQGSPERLAALQWVSFAMTEVEVPLLEIAVHGAADPARREAGTQRWHAAATAVEGALNGRSFLVGDRFSVADIVMGGVLLIATTRSLDGEHPQIGPYVAALRARPAFGRAVAATDAPFA